MKIPKTIKIGGKTFKVILRTNKEGSEDAGNAQLWHQIIWLDKDQHEENMEETLLHEIIEIIKIENNLDMPHQNISTMSVNLYQVLKDNFLK